MSNHLKTILFISFKTDYFGKKIQLRVNKIILTEKTLSD